MGEADALEAALRAVDSLSIFFVTFSHCPALEIPRKITELNNLKGLEIYNSTIADWSSDAAIRNKHHPFISVVYLVRTNMTEFPRGLLDPDFPPSLMDLEMCRVNLTSLPNEFAARWPRHLTFLNWELSQLTAIPDFIGRFQIDQLSFAGNNIKQIPLELLSAQSPQVFSVADNPSLTQLPASVRDVSLLYKLQLDYTNLTSLPAWVESAVRLGCTASAGGTPLCGTHDRPSRVGCDVVDRHKIYRYPLEFKDAQRALSAA
ncbi:TPA: hypothetical protein N0F65_003191 [Lagenidium giganteum]|uniref:Uncharacterized protein n=1 Tax=Lagenidium giganteum TaxID=4803 RepID=A0AAV2ZCT6_9STRA|nr:TPA: hypothetical protein N0F65_003191 [Lagenidium giganteum]